MGKVPTLQQWQHYRIRTVNPVSGAAPVRIEPVALTDLIYGDPDLGITPKVPNELIPIAERVEFEGIDAEAIKRMTPSERISYQRFKEWLVSDRLVEPKMTPEQVRTVMPSDDVLQLVEVALHMDYPERRAMASFREIEGGNTSNGSGGDAGDVAE